MTFAPEAEPVEQPSKVLISSIHKQKDKKDYKDFDTESLKKILAETQKDISDEQNKQIADLNRLLEKLKPQLKGWHKMTFVLLGIASLQGWNAILSAIDFFQTQYPKGQFMDVAFYFPIPMMLTNCLSAFICPILARYFTLNQRIAYTLMGTCLTMVSVTLIAIFFNTQFGFWITLVILTIQGFIDSVNTSSLISLSGMVHPILNNTYWTCTALSEITTNFLRIITLAWFGDGESAINTGSALYFSIAAFVYVVSSTLQILFADSEYFHIILKRQKVYSKIEEIKNLQATFDLQKMQTAQNISQAQLEIQLQTQKKKSLSLSQSNAFVKYLKELSQVFKCAGAIPVYIAVNYIQTFMVFPGVSIFQKSDYHLLGYPWAPVVMITIFNVGDIIGKQSGFIKQLHNLYLAYGVVLFRFMSIAFFLLIAHQKESEFFQNDLFAMANMFVFALANGFSTTALFNLGTRNTKDPKILDLINYFNGFSIAFGIMIGTFLALPLNESN